MQISIIICAYNEEKYIGNCLTSVLKFVTADVAEVIVVDNASCDRTAEIARAFGGIVRVVLEPRKGLTRARQKGLIEARGELVAFIDADTIVDSHWYKIMDREFTKDNKLCCLSGPYYYFDIASTDNLFTNWWYTSCLKIWHWFINKIIIMPRGMVIMGGNFVAKKTAIVLAGGFDSNIEFYGEDTDIGRRLQKVGKILYSTDFWIYSSARRLNNEGLIKTGIKYLLNYISVLMFKRPVIHRHNDIR